MMELLWWFSMVGIALAALNNGPNTTTQPSSSLKIMVGSYAAAITTLQFDPATKNFTATSVTSGNDSGQSPAFMAFSPNGRFVFVVDEESSFDGQNQTGSVNSYEVDHNGSLRKIANAFAGADPVSIDVSPDGKNVIVAAYTSGSSSRFSVNEKGQFTSARPLQTFIYNHSGPNPDRQTHSFIHQAKYGPDGRLAFFTDLGGDRVYIHRVMDDTGALGVMAHEIRLSAGSGPRHLSIRERGAGVYDIYLICELSNQMIFIKLKDGSHGLKSSIKQVLSTLPANIIDQKSFGAGEVAITRDGRHVYGTNRQTDFTKPTSDNSFVVYTRDLHTGLLCTSPSHYPILSGAMTPRHFSFSDDPEQCLIVVGCQQADTLLVYSRDISSGALEILGSTSIKKPAVQFFIPPRET